MKNFFKRWLEKLEATNKESFGSEPLDCCTVGREKKTSKSVKLNSDRK